MLCEKYAYIDSSVMADHVLGLSGHSPVCLLDCEVYMD